MPGAVIPRRRSAQLGRVIVDHVGGAVPQRRGDREPELAGDVQVHDKLELLGAFSRDRARVVATEDLMDLPRADLDTTSQA